MAGHGEPGNDIVGGVETSISKQQQSERDRQYDIILGDLNGAQPGASPVPLREGTLSSEAEPRTSSTSAAAATLTEGSTTANAASTTTTSKPITSTTTSIPTPAVYLPVNFTYPSRIYAIAKAFNFTDLKELNFTYNHVDKFGYVAHVERIMNFRRNRRQASNTDSDETVVNNFRWALKFYQKFMGLPITGNLDTETIGHMKKPRCGNRDLGAEFRHQKETGIRKVNGRSKRYFLAGSRWRRNPENLLRYCISRFPRRATESNLTNLVHYEIWRAFKAWSAHIPFKFKPMPCVNRAGEKIKVPNIDVRFEMGEHGDGDPFDGPGGVLAHAYFPEFGGDLHFDESERWTNSEQGTNLFAVSLHEIGHVLGLEHSEKPDAIMAPVYKYTPNMKLTPDDIIGVHAIYDQ